MRSKLLNTIKFLTNSLVRSSKNLLEKRGKTDKMVVPHVVTQDIVVHQGKALVTQSTYDLILIELKRFY